MSSQGVPASSTLTRTPKVMVDRNIRDNNGKVKKTKTTLPAHQMGECRHTDTVYTQTVKGVPANLFRNAGAKFSATLEQKAFTKLESMCLKVNVSLTGGTANATVNLCIPTYWFDRYEIRANNGSKHLNIVYNDNAHLALATLDPVTLENYARLMGMSVANNVFTVGTEVLLDASGDANVEVFIPMVGSWIDSGDLFWKGVDGDLIIDFFPNGNIRGTQGNTYQVDCSGIEFVIQTEQLTDDDMATQTKFHNSVASEINFLDVTPVNFYSQTVNASNNVKLELDALNGEYSFLAVYIRSTASNASTAPRTALQYLGNSAKIDLLDPGSKSILGSGSGISMNYLKNFVTPSHFKNRLLENHNITIVPFCGSCSESFQGVRDGCVRFDGSRYYLSITPDSNWTNGSYDIVIYGYKFSKLYNAFGKLAVTE
jgi:hypothetical protein